MTILPILRTCTRIILLLLLFVMPLTAQEPIIVGESQVFRLSGQGATDFVYESDGGEVLTVTVRGLSVPEGEETDIIRDVVVTVLNPDGKQIAYNHRHQTDNADLLPTDAAIPKLKLDRPGVYLIRVDTYGGIFQSEAELTLTVADMFDTRIIEDTAGQTVITGVLPRDAAYQYTFEAAAGEVVTITARDLSRTLDTRLLLLDADGATLTENDDHGTDDPALDVLDSRIAAFRLPADGVYTLVLLDFIGRAGRFEVVITRAG